MPLCAIVSTSTLSSGLLRRHRVDLLSRFGLLHLIRALRAYLVSTTTSCEQCTAEAAVVLLSSVGFCAMDSMKRKRAAAAAAAALTAQASAPSDGSGSPSAATALPDPNADPNADRDIYAKLYYGTQALWNQLLTSCSHRLGCCCCCRRAQPAASSGELTTV
jgi:hypothetical protein